MANGANSIDMYITRRLINLRLKKVKEHIFTPYISFYLRNVRKKNDFDFKDWETTTPIDIYGFYKTPLEVIENEVFNKTLHKDETPTITPNVTFSIPSLPTVENLKTVKQEISEVTSKQELTSNTESTVLNLTSETVLPPSQETNTTIHLTTSSVISQNSSTPYIEDTVTTDVSLTSGATTEDLLNWLATTPTGEYTTVIPPPTVQDIQDMNPAPTAKIQNQATFTLTTTKDRFLDDLEYKIKNKHGYFTASLSELLLVFFNKTSGDMQKLLTALNTRVESLVVKDEIPVFGQITVEVFQSVIQMLILSPADVRKEYIAMAIYSVENRHTAMEEAANAVFDIIDGIYTHQDLIRIASVLKRINEFPNNTADRSLTIATDTLDVFVFKPHSRILDTAKEKLLLAEINTLLQQKLYPGQSLGRRFIKRKRNVPKLTNFHIPGKFTGKWKSTIHIPGYHRYSRKKKLIPAQGAEENILKLNIKNALIRSVTVNRRKIMKKFKKVHDVDSFSDNEAILKSNIYKFLDMSTDFRKKLRTSHILRRTSPA